jgi:hypothetical protein
LETKRAAFSKMVTYVPPMYTIMLNHLKYSAFFFVFCTPFALKYNLWKILGTFAKAFFKV